MDLDILNILWVLIGLAGLYYGGEFLVTGASRVAVAFRISPLIIGLTIVAIGTSTPELFVSILAALQGIQGLSLGNVVGSNIANIGLILGLTGIISVVVVQETLVRREIPILIVVTLFATMLILDGEISRLDGLLLLFGFGVFTYLFYALATSQDADDVDVDMPDVDDPAKVNLRIEAARILVGIIMLMVGAQLMVMGASSLARALGVSELVIGVTIVAFGTSLPELATSLTAAKKGENDIAVGNVIGSNVANLLLVLGATASIAPIDVGSTDLSIIEYLVMIGFTLMLLPLVRKRQLATVESALFLGVYIAFIFYSFFSGTGV